ncbi:enoyl-CoA hydratase-related protein [Pseudoalteromonas denitrificans]|uniref:Enoyl-CoA hydratase/carnithine racemase n=1 Tax=Pseudoalteromonas denitrificans DSM 6059 TaxID=1123010 RepID=A0A1I1IZ40_9GAMM|nr:enoyl-CoA hydratase-related protein [Pseudoalteromonas denitrificans]SFC38943.1 Enoyl-CoA hydratase/carnithine racemase [Pseudoalteromonas denitrificans DSM 6059]
MSQSLIIAETINKNIRHIQFNRQKYKNALTEQMYHDLTQQLLLADEDDTIRIIMLTGDEDVFCAGNDLNDFINNPPTSTQANSFIFLLALNRLKKPLIAGVSGSAIGIGTTMLLHCDYVVASTSALFKMPFVSLGCTPEGGSSLLLPLIIGQRKSAELLMLGESFKAEQANELGIINRICEQGECLANTLAIATKMACQPPAAIQAAKQIMKANIINQVEQTILGEGELFVQRLQSVEAKEALTAFIEKRQPVFN